MGIVSKGIVSKSDKLSSYAHVSFQKFHNSFLTDYEMSLLLFESQERNQTYLTYPCLLRQLSTNFRNRNGPHLVKWLQCRQLVTPSASWDVQGVFSRRANNTLRCKSSSPQDCRVSSMQKHLFLNLRFPVIPVTNHRTSFDRYSFKCNNKICEVTITLPWTFSAQSVPPIDLKLLGKC